MRLVPLVNDLPLAAAGADEDVHVVFIFEAGIQRGIVRKVAYVIIGQKNYDLVGIIAVSPVLIVGELFVTDIGKPQEYHIAFSLKMLQNQFHPACDVICCVDFRAEFFDIDEVESSAGGEE